MKRYSPGDNHLLISAKYTASQITKTPVGAATLRASGAHLQKRPTHQLALTASFIVRFKSNQCAERYEPWFTPRRRSRIRTLIRQIEVQQLG